MTTREKIRAGLQLDTVQVIEELRDAAGRTEGYTILLSVEMHINGFNTRRRFNMGIGTIDTVADWWQREDAKDARPRPPCR